MFFFFFLQFRYRIYANQIICERFSKFFKYFQGFLRNNFYLEFKANTKIFYISKNFKPFKKKQISPQKKIIILRWFYFLYKLGLNEVRNFFFSNS